MEIINILKLLNSTVLHEWLHAKELKKISNNQNVFIVHGLGDNEKDKKLKEDYFINSSEYEPSTIDGFSIYSRKDKKKMSRGRADVDNRLLLSKEGVKKALRRPFDVGISILLLSILIFILISFFTINNNKYILFFIAGIVAFYFILLGAFCAAGCFFGTNSDYICWKNPKIYIEKLDEDFLEDVYQNISDKKQLERGHIILNEQFYNELIVGKESIICEYFDCSTMSVLINGCLDFIHNTQKYNVKLILKKGLIIPEDSDSENDTLGSGIYCYDYNEYLKGKNPILQRGTTVSIRGTYEGEYLKCVYGYAARNDNESLREYLLLSNALNIALIEKDSVDETFVM